MRALRRILEGNTGLPEVTDVTRKSFSISIALLFLVSTAAGDTSSATPNSPESVYLQLQAVGLDGNRVYQIRGASLDRGAVHLSFDDGTVAFTRDVGGHITGAFFQGDGELLLVPPNTVERASLVLFTDAAILEERFSAVYLRFNDDVYGELKSSLRTAEDPNEFTQHWNDTATALAQEDALRLLISFNSAPAKVNATGSGDRFLHAYVEGNRLGPFEVRYDSLAPEQISAGQHKTKDGVNYYNLWTSFSIVQRQDANSDPGIGQTPSTQDFDITQCHISTQIKPPTDIASSAVLKLIPRHNASRVLLFELSHLLDVKSITVNGEPTAYIHNQAVEGSQLAKRGNDALAVFLQSPLTAGVPIELKIDYAGSVLSQAGSGLLYVGEHGTWYPNIGLVMSSFDLTFRYPEPWTLIATGVRKELKTEGNEQVSRWVSETKVPVAGFNLGKYSTVTAQAGSVKVETYATGTVEKGFAVQPPPDLPLPTLPVPRQGPTHLPLQPLPPPPPSPSHNLQMVNSAAVEALDFYQKRFGAYPYSSLALTQFPGRTSQGWPGLIFLSTYAFLGPDERERAESNEGGRLLLGQVIAHETAHQWWGDLVTWSGYRDQWMMEALANYSSLMLLESKNPIGFHKVMDYYRDDLLVKNKDGKVPMDAGPVTLGVRLSSSEFPGGYVAISYGRGTWMMHMLRTMLSEGKRPATRTYAKTAGDEPFIRVLSRLRSEYQGQAVTTSRLLHLCEAELPRSLWYEGKPSLDWFYDSWLNGTAVPEFHLHDIKFANRQEGILVTGTIVQEHAPDTLVTSVPLYATVAGKNIFLGRVFAEGHETSFHISAPTGTRKIVLDPEHTLLSRNK